MEAFAGAVESCPSFNKPSQSLSTVSQSSSAAGFTELSESLQSVLLRIKSTSSEIFKGLVEAVGSGQSG